MIRTLQTVLLALSLSLCAVTAEAGGKRPFRAGIALSMHSEDPKASYLPLIRQIKETGATDISILVHFYQDDAASKAPARHPFKTPSDRMFLEAVSESHKLGLRVFVMPILLLEKPKDDDWRGSLKPPDWKTWFDAYEREVLHFARLAEKGGAQVFSVGSELSSTDGRVADWKRIIRKVSAVFTGMLTYSANWDHYDEVSFWDELDVMGISGYYELTSSLTPTRDELVMSWKRVQTKIRNWREKEGIKIPLIFTEIGYASQDGCASKPWNYFLSKTVDLEEQKLCYEAFIEVWDRASMLEGVYIYEWWGDGGVKDTRYTPRGKPAEKVMKDWFARIRKRNAKK